MDERKEEEIEPKTKAVVEFIEDVTNKQTGLTLSCKKINQITFEIPKTINLFQLNFNFPSRCQKLYK